jgi:hypothetical protein
MGNMDGWDLTLLLVAGYLAIVTLVRLMARHRNQVLQQLRYRAEDAKRKKHQADMQNRNRRTA